MPILSNFPSGSGSDSTITHEWDGTVLRVTSDSGTSEADLKGETGDSGVFIGSDEPTDPDVLVWICPDEEDDSGVVGAIPVETIKNICK